MASNAGSTATVTGNPRNMIIGTTSGISYAHFAAALAPAPAIGVALTVLLIALMWAREFWTRDRLFADLPTPRPHRFMAGKTLAVAAALMVAFLPLFVGWRWHHSLPPAPP